MWKVRWSDAIEEITQERKAMPGGTQEACYASPLGHLGQLRAASNMMTNFTICIHTYMHIYAYAGPIPLVLALGGRGR